MDGKAVTPGVILVADGDPAVTDRIASSLRDQYTVRTAYTARETLDSLDDDVGVVIIDDEMSDLDSASIVDRIRDRELLCQVCVLTHDVDSDVALGSPPDARLRKPVSRTELKGTVERLLLRATYRAKLEKYYALSRRRASLAASGAGEDAATLDDRLQTLRDELADALGSLDYEEAFEIALDIPENGSPD